MTMVREVHQFQSPDSMKDLLLQQAMTICNLKNEIVELKRTIVQKDRDNELLKNTIELNASQMPASYGAVMQMDKHWRRENKFEYLNKLLSVREALFESANDDEALNNSSPSFSIMQGYINQVEQLKMTHEHLNDKISRLKKKENERLNNLNELLSILHLASKKCDLQKSHWAKKQDQLNKWTNALHLIENCKTTVGNAVGLVSVNNKDFNELIKAKKKFGEAYEVLAQQSEVYLACLRKNEQLLDDLKNKCSIGETKKEQQEIDGYIQYFTVKEILQVTPS